MLTIAFVLFVLRVVLNSISGYKTVIFSAVVPNVYVVYSVDVS